MECYSNHMFACLVSIALHEIQRVGHRASFKPKYVLQMIEKFAVSELIIGSRKQMCPSPSLIYLGSKTYLKEKNYF